MANKQKLSTLVVNNVLAFVRPFASKKLQTAIKILLSPCCDPVITGTSVCVGLNQVITFTVENSVYGATGVEVIALTDSVILTSTISDDGKTITATSDGALTTGEDMPFLVTILYGTNDSGQSGAYLLDVATSNLSSCVP